MEITIHPGNNVLSEFQMLVATAISIGCIHTILGPDHYVPFIAMAKANRWSMRKTALLTACCGFAHVISSVLIGLIGLGLGSLVFSLNALESFRGDTASWLLIGFGMAYLLFGLHIIVRNKPHSHLPSEHAVDHSHSKLETTSELTSHSEGFAATWSPWAIFLILAFGPCEALIPMLMYPASNANWFAVVAVVTAFMAATLVTMIVTVLVMSMGLRWLRLPDLHRYSHALAGAAILLCGLGVKFGL